MRLGFWNWDHHSNQIYKLLRAAIFVSICLAAATGAHTQDSSAPLSKDDVLNLLQSGVPPKRIATLAQEHKINFQVDDATAVELRDAGANDTLITALQSVAPSTAPTVLVIRSRPGGAQVYIDDEPIGTTSSEGRLKISTLSSGRHQVRVSAEGYQDYDHSIDLPHGELTEVDARLQPKIPALQNHQTLPENGQSVNPSPTPSVQPTPQGPRPVVYFFRPNNFNANLITPNIYCDGVSLGKLPNARYFSVPFPPGKHVFESTNKKSHVELDLANGNTYYIMVYMVGFPAKGAVSYVPNENAVPQISSLSPCGTNSDANGNLMSGCGH